MAGQGSVLSPLRKKDNAMELTITQNGAIYAIQHRPGKVSRLNGVDGTSADASNGLRTLRTSVGEFAMRPAQAGCYLELIVGHVHRALGLYQTIEAAREALINRRSGFQTWDALDAGNARAQAGALKQ